MMCGDDHTLDVCKVAPIVWAHNKLLAQKAYNIEPIARECEHRAIKGNSLANHMDDSVTANCKHCGAKHIAEAESAVTRLRAEIDQLHSKLTTLQAENERLKLTDNIRVDTLAVRERKVLELAKENERYKRALEEICEVDYETHEALQSTCIDLARAALGVKRSQGGE